MSQEEHDLREIDGEFEILRAAIPKHDDGIRQAINLAHIFLRDVRRIANAIEIVAKELTEEIK